MTKTSLSSRAVLVLVLIVSLAFFVSPVHAANRVWSEYVLAAVQTGISADTNRPTYQVATMGLVGPDSIFSPTINHCTQNALASAGVQLRGDLNQTPGFNSIIEDLSAQGTSLSLESLNLQKAQRASAIAKRLSEASEKVKTALLTCMGTEANQVNLQISIAYALRECRPDNPLCKWDAKSKTTPRSYPGVFERIYSWSAVTQSRPVNEWIAPDANGVAINVDGSAWDNPIAWPSPLSPETALANLERLVALARKSEEISISYTVPAITGVYRETALRFVDELNEPFAAMQFLASGNNVLTLVSDELGRSRLKDCAQLRGKRDTESIGECAGFKIEATEIHACLNGSRCLPELRKNALAGLLMLQTPMDLNALLESTQLPRVGIDVPFPAWVQKAKECSALDTEEASVGCLLKGTMAPEDYAMVECVKGTSASEKTSGLLDCAERLASGSGKVLIHCMRDGKGDPATTAFCAVEESIPSNLQPAVSCLKAQSGNSNVAACLAGAALGHREKQIYDCYVANAGSKQAALLCAVAQDLPTDARLVVVCAQESAGAWQGMATCIAREKLKLSGDLGRIVGCGLSSGGSVVGTAACAAGTGLRAEQAIVLQCAATATTGPGFLVCTGGMLAFKEFTQCKDSRIGNDNCFGENNEIRRFVRALGLPDIGPNSIAAQVGNVYLDIINIQVAYLEGVAEAGKVFVREVARVLEQVGGLINKATDVGENVIRCVRKPWDC